MKAPKVYDANLAKDFSPDPRNANRGTPRGGGMLEKSIGELGAGRSIVTDRNGLVVAGNKSREQLSAAGLVDAVVVESDGTRPIVVKRTDWDLTKARDPSRRYAMLDNRVAEVNLDWDPDELGRMLGEGFDFTGLWSEDELAKLLGTAGTGLSGISLAERFGVPPFSVLDARQGYWQTRKATWIGMGIQSELGRGEHLLSLEAAMERKKAGPKADAKVFSAKAQGDPVSRSDTERGGGTSIFDPVLCELIYRWFSPPRGIVLDPFAGGSVRGIVAASLGHPYTGIDLRKEQVGANERQRTALFGTAKKPNGHPAPAGLPRWVVGNALDIDKLLPKGELYDLVFSCPPYFDLERYSDDTGDLSNAGTYEKFLTDYRRIIALAVGRLRPHRFACFVVGDIRDKKGLYRGFVADTIKAFEAAGARLHNEAILVSPLGSLALRVAHHFPKGRKLGKTHQNVLVFWKGDPDRIQGEMGPIEVVIPKDVEDPT